MKLLDILLPVVTTDFSKTVAFYKRITGKEVMLEAAHDGYYLNLIDSFVVLGADHDEALEIPKQVDIIFLVEDVDAYWEILKKECLAVLVGITSVSTGRRFIVRQADGKVVEYLELNG